MNPTVIEGVESHENDLQEEVADLERRLAAAKAKLSKAKSLTHQQPACKFSHTRRSVSIAQQLGSIYY